MEDFILNMCLHSSSYAMRHQIKFSLFKDIANLGSMYPYDVSTLYIWNRDYKKRVLRIILSGLAWIFSKSSTRLPLVNCSTFRVVNSSSYVWFLGFFHLPRWKPQSLAVPCRLSCIWRVWKDHGPPTFGN